MDSHELEPKIGRWVAFCCHMDLFQIKDTDDVRELEEDRVEGLPMRIWETKNEALEEIAQQWENRGDLEKAIEARSLKE